MNLIVKKFKIYPQKCLVLGQKVTEENENENEKELSWHLPADDEEVGWWPTQERLELATRQLSSAADRKQVPRLRMTVLCTIMLRSG
jgi:hypothetical protein